MDIRIVRHPIDNYFQSVKIDLYDETSNDDTHVRFYCIVQNDIIVSAVREINMGVNYNVTDLSYVQRHYDNYINAESNVWYAIPEEE